MLDQTTIVAIEAPLDCIPRKIRVRLADNPRAVRIVVDPGRTVPELNELNNTLPLPDRGR